MKLLVISVFPPVDIPDAEHAYRISAQLAQQGDTVHVLCQCGAQVPTQERLHLHPIMDAWSWAELPRLIREIARIKPDSVLLVFVGHMYGRHPMITFVPTFAKIVRRQLRFVTQFEHFTGAVIGTRPPWPARLFHKAIRTLLGKDAGWEHGTLLRDSDAIVVLSEKHISPLQNNYAGVSGKSILIPPPVLLRVVPDEKGVQRERQRAEMGLKPDEILLAYLGYIYVGKGLETLLAAFEQVCRSHENVRLVIIGGTVLPSASWDPDYAERVFSQAKHLMCAEKVQFTGGFALDSDEPSRFLRAADLAVLPFDLGVQLNNSSLAGVTAHGLPVVTTRGNTMEPVFMDRENVLLCSPVDAHAMAAAICEAIGDAVLRQKLSEGASRLSAEWYSWKPAMKKMQTVLARPANENVSSQFPS